MIVVKNHVGSSKSMEPDVAVDLFQRATMSKIKCYVTLVMMTPQLMHTYTKKNSAEGQILMAHTSFSQYCQIYLPSVC